MKAGKDIYCEKLMACTVEEESQRKSQSKNFNLRFSKQHPNRYRYAHHCKRSPTKHVREMRVFQIARELLVIDQPQNEQKDDRQHHSIEDLTSYS
jgi:hypothetical protein